MAATDVAPSIALLALSAIHESPTNPRRHFDEQALSELTASIREQGVLSPILVRPAPGGAPGYEIVYGHRRTRAAAAAGLSYVPAMVASMDDRQALETQLQENSQRADVHPLEEAEGYRRLLEEFGGEVEEIASKVGKSSSYIYKRLKLLSLEGSAREAFLAGVLDASRALLVARIPDAELQAAAVRQMRLGRDDTYSMSLAEAARMVERNFMLRLAEAPFSTKPCAKCPRRTGSQAALFEDVSSPDLCTDAACYQRKADEAWEAKKATAQKRGQKVLDEEETKKAFPWSGQLAYGSGYVTADRACNFDVQRRTWGELLQQLPEYKRGERSALARTEEGTVHELFVEADAVEALREAGIVPTPDAKEDDDGARESEWDKNNRERQLQLRAEELALGECAARAESASDAQLLPLLVEVLVADDNGGAEAAQRRGLGLGEDGSTASVVMAHAGLSTAVARGLVLELAVGLAMGAIYQDEERRALLQRVCSALGVDLERLEREVREDDEKERKKAEKAAKRAAKKSSKKAAGEEVSDA